MDDNSIIKLFNERDEQALSKTQQKYGGLCFSVARNILSNSEDAEECVNDVYLAAWNAIPPERPKKLSSYLARITRNKAIDRYRKQAAKRRGGGEMEAVLSELSENIAGKSETEALFDRNFLAEKINEFLKSLPKDKADVFLMRYFFCRSLEEISGATGYSYSKISTMLCRTRTALKEKLNKEGIEV